MIVDAKRRLVLVSRNDTGRSLLQLALFMLFDSDGWRSHHQKLGVRFTFRRKAGAYVDAARA